MPRYIDAELTKRELDGIGNVHGGIIAAIKSIIDDIPTADVEEIRHGEWINGHSLDDTWYHTCSNCNTESRETFFDFRCPVCGAKMDGKEGERK